MILQIIMHSIVYVKRNIQEEQYINKRKFVQ